MGLGRRDWVHASALAAHVGLTLSMGISLFAVDAAAWLRLGLIAILLVPLVLTFRGLARAHKGTLRWLAFVLVPYAGFGSIEVIALTSTASALWLMCALLELGLVMTIIRRPLPRAPAAREES